MTTYASRHGLSRSLLTINSIVFCFGCMLFIYGAVMMVGVEGLPTPSGLQPTDGQAVKHYQDRFPSVGSGTVTLVFGILIMFNSGLGITGIHLDDAGMVDTFGYSSIICSFIKFLFIFSTLYMHQFNYKYNPLATIGPKVTIMVCVVEIATGFAGCALSKVMKLGDAAKNNVLPWPPKV